MYYLFTLVIVVVALATFYESHLTSTRRKWEK